MPPWYTIAKRKKGGAANRDPKAHNERILAYHETTTLKATTDEVAWCAAFVNWWLNAAGKKAATARVPYHGSTGARSWSIHASVPSPSFKTQR